MPAPSAIVARMPLVIFDLQRVGILHIFRGHIGGDEFKILAVIAPGHANIAAARQ